MACTDIQKRINSTKPKKKPKPPNLINEYRNAWQQTPEDRTIGNPIYRVPIPQTY
jgi:hypothetical protein